MWFAEGSVADPLSVVDASSHASVNRHADQPPRSFLVLPMWRFHFFRFRRINFAQPDRQENHGANREKFALPVLQRLEPEAGRRHVIRQGQRRLPVLQAFLVKEPVT